MRIAIVYNRDSQNVINLFGNLNREKIGLKTIERLRVALKNNGHNVVALEADKDFISRLEEFMPRVVKGERPGMVFNVSYGIQGQARYTHVPSILEMMGIPYVASGPLAHSLALDKVVTKMILRQHGLPTPDFFVLDQPEVEIPELPYPMIVKPKNEAVSFGLKIVNTEQELREAASVIFDEFRQAVLAEQFIEGREINVGLLGNSPPEAFPPVELSFGNDGPQIYTYEDKTGRSGRTIEPICPAPLGEELSRKAQEISVKAFNALGLYDCARVDMRLDKNNQLYILEINSLPSLGEHGSYLVGASEVGLDFPKFVNRLVEVSCSRYYGTPQPPQLSRETQDPGEQICSYITQRRDKIERRLEEWCRLSSRSGDPLGIEEATVRFSQSMQKLGLHQCDSLSDNSCVQTWQTKAGLDNGTLLILHLDVPSDTSIAPQVFRRDPEWLYGDGIGTSRASIVSLEYTLQALRNVRKLSKLPMGVLAYSDEGLGARSSSQLIKSAALKAKQVMVLRPGNLLDKVVTQRRGQRIYRLIVEGKAIRPGKSTQKTDVLRWLWGKLENIAELGSQKKRVSLSVVDIQPERLPLLLPHRVGVTLLMTYLTEAPVSEVEDAIKKELGKGGPRWELKLISDRPAMIKNKISSELLEKLNMVAEKWDIPLESESSVWPSVAGLVPPDVPCICGVGPVTRQLGTPDESVQRISVVKRALLLSEFLASQGVSK